MPLKNWDVSINYGIKTGFNDAFIITEEKRSEILKNCKTDEERKRTDELIRPILRGRDIKRFGYEWAGLYVILAYYCSHLILQDKYPAIYEHLLKYKLELQKRGQCRYTSNGKPNLDAKYPGQHHWLELDNNPTLKKLEDFSKPKIIWAELARTGNAFTFDANNFFVGNTGYILVMTEELIKSVGYEFLLAMLNSKAMLFYLDMISTRLDETGWRWLRQYVDCLPVPILNKNKQGVIGEIVSRELIQKTTKGQKEIDDLIYRIYGFNEEESALLSSWQRA